MWEIALAPETVMLLKKLPKETSKSLFLFLNDYLPSELTPTKLKATKIKTLKGISCFPKKIPKGMAHIFTSINFETHRIKVLHIAIHLTSSKLKHAKKSHN